MDFLDKQKRLIATLQGYGSCAVAFSGGVDSALVAKAAVIALGDSAVAITGTSDSLAAGELEQAAETAKLIGIRHRVIATHEFDNPNYVANATDRCFHCKDELYTKIDSILRELQVDVVVNGANVDDLGDFRPGLHAAANHHVRSPLADCGLTKAEVRRLAMEWQLPVWDKPATPCLSSRVAYGEEVTPERLRMIDRSERYLKELGFRIVRVRYHTGDMARIEVATDELPRLWQLDLAEVSRSIREFGFRWVTVDLEGFRSGSLNGFVALETLELKP